MEEMDFRQQEETAFNLKATILQYLRHWLWFVIALFLCLGAAWLYLKRATPMYQVSASILIKDEKKGASNEMLKDLDLFAGSKLVDNEAEVLKSRMLMEKVVDELNLTVSYYNEDRFRDYELYSESPIQVAANNLQDYAYENPVYIRPLGEQKFELLDESRRLLGTFLYTQSIKSKYGTFRVFKQPDMSEDLVKVRFISRDRMIDQLLRDINVGLLNKNSTVLSLTYQSAVPQKGKAVLSKLLDVYTFTSLEDKNREATNTLRFIEERLKLVTGELSDVEKDVERYKTSAGITDLSAESNLFLEKVKDNDSKLSEVDIQIKVLEGVERYVNSEGAASNVAPATLMVTDPVLTSYIEGLSQLELQKEKISRGARSSNPFLETINTQIANTRQAIRENLANQKRSLTITRTALQGNNSRLEGAIRSIPRKEREYVGVQRQQNIKENLYLILLQKREETALSYASTVTDSRIVDVPNSTSLPVSPKKNIIYLAALMLGILLPAGYIYGREMLIDTVQSKKEIEAKTGLAVFGEIALRDRKDKSNFIDAKGRDFIAEQFRTIRTNLQYLNKEDNGKATTILLTSSMSGEGKTFVALNLAASIGMLGKKVLMMELDLRKPKLSEYMNIKPKKGITHYLTGQAEEHELITATVIESMYLISSGPIPPNPSELLAGDKIQKLIEVYQRSFDYIILDMPPIGLVSDASLLAPLADTCFYLIRHEITPRNHLNFLKDLSKSKRFKSINVIFNGVNYKNSREYGYGYGSYYGYGMYGYGDEKKRKGLFSRRK